MPTNTDPAAVTNMARRREQLDQLQQLKECECPARKALERLKGAGDRRVMDGSVMISAPFLDSVLASLSAPCPCDELREQRDSQYQRAQSLQDSLLTEIVRADTAEAERDSLRAQVEEHQRWLRADSQHAENQRLRAELETWRQQETPGIAARMRLNAKLTTELAASRERERLLREALTETRDEVRLYLKPAEKNTLLWDIAERCEAALAIPEGTVRP